MTQRTVTLPEELDAFVAAQVASGHYASPDDVVREALSNLEREEREDAAKMASLIEAIEEGEASGIYEGDPFTDIRAKYGLSPRS